MDCILALENLATGGFQMRSWVHHSLISDHFSILLQVEKGNNLPKLLFKLNSTWIDEECFKYYVENQWPSLNYQGT